MAISDIKKPGLIALTISVVAVFGYVSYRTLSPSLEPSPEPEPAVTDAPTVEPAETLPEFTLSNLSGEQQSIQSWPDQALLINFWATWCAPCLREIPLLKEFQDTHRDNSVTVVGIAVDRPEPVAAYVEDMTFNYPVLVGQADGMDAAASFGVDVFALPFTVFTDHDANVLGVHTGELHDEDLENLAAVLEDLGAGRIDLERARARVAGRI